jgi:predicted outer membrane repeat protein
MAIQVNGEGDFTSLTEALSTAVKGDTVSISGGVFSENANGDGKDVEFNITGATFSDNVAPAQGGALKISASGANHSIENSLFCNNAAGNDNSGGAVYFSSGESLSINGSTFTGNHSTNNHGGAIYASGNVTITNSHFNGNYTTWAGSANKHGGAIIFSKPEATNHITGCTFSGNTAVYGIRKILYTGWCIIGYILLQF